MLVIVVSKIGGLFHSIDGRAIVFLDSPDECIGYDLFLGHDGPTGCRHHSAWRLITYSLQHVSSHSSCQTRRLMSILFSKSGRRDDSTREEKTAKNCPGRKCPEHEIPNRQQKLPSISFFRWLFLTVVIVVRCHDTPEAKKRGILVLRLAPQDDKKRYVRPNRDDGDISYDCFVVRIWTCFENLPFQLRW